MLSGEVPRRLLPVLAESLTSSPAVALTGPRTAGKSTLARQFASEVGGTWIDLDDPGVRHLAAADPAAFVTGLPEPIVVDEFQRVPQILAAIKAELNLDRRPGRFVLTGSARHDAVPELADFLTGRVDLMTLWPFAVSELQPEPGTFVDRLLGGELPRRRTAAASRADIVELVLRGGFPIAVELAGRARARWFANLARLVVERVADDVGPVRDTGILSRFLRLAAATTAQTRNAAELGREVDLGRDQAGVYLHLLELVHLVFTLPAWSTNVTSSVAKRPKLHLVDSGLAASLLGVTADGLQPTDPAGASRFGPLLETFVVTEVCKQLGWSEHLIEASHYRTTAGVEVDLVLETPDGRVAAVEVKASSSPSQTAATGLRHLRDRLGPLFVGGVVLTTGTQAQRIDDRIAVAPVDELWVASELD
ncbi:MAG: DUF4143 domain-containing protein [Pseudonocardia sp.]|nr:DUF4143 domain-containing protein [Pseudonocardia sp.]